MLQEGCCGDRRPALTVEGPALVDDKVHGAHSLLNGGRHIWAMAEDQVHILHIQALQGGLQMQLDFLSSCLQPQTCSIQGLTWRHMLAAGLPTQAQGPAHAQSVSETVP